MPDPAIEPPVDSHADHPDSHAQVQLVDDYSGSGKVSALVVNGVQQWSWAHHIDGPMSPDAQELWAALVRGLGVTRRRP